MSIKKNKRKHTGLLLGDVLGHLLLLLLVAKNKTNPCETLVLRFGENNFAEMLPLDVEERLQYKTR
jgi:hypothetical protein